MDKITRETPSKWRGAFPESALGSSFLRPRVCVTAVDPLGGKKKKNIKNKTKSTGLEKGRAERAESLTAEEIIRGGVSLSFGHGALR